MKPYLGTAIVVLLSMIACTTKEKEFSKSYLAFKSYLEEAKIPETDIIYFYAGKPRMPLPNVYCFDSNGTQISSPPQCFQYIREYIGFMNDSIMPHKKNGISINTFLDSVPIMDVYDQQVKQKNLARYDYYLFIDFIAFPDTSIQNVLYKAKEGVTNSKKKIKLFLIHAISEKNAGLLPKKPGSMPDKVTEN
jgi:hypothetical protein